MSTDRTTEILNYLSAISREVGALRTEMKNRFDEVNGRFEEVESRLDKAESRFDRLEAEMRAGFAAVRADVRHLADKVDVMNQDLLDLRANQRGLEKRMDALERKQA